MTWGFEKDHTSAIEIQQEDGDERCYKWGQGGGEMWGKSNRGELSASRCPHSTVRGFSMQQPLQEQISVTTPKSLKSESSTKPIHYSGCCSSDIYTVYTNTSGAKCIKLHAYSGVVISVHPKQEIYIHNLFIIHINHPEILCMSTRCLTIPRNSNHAHIHLVCM